MNGPSRRTGGPRRKLRAAASGWVSKSLDGGTRYVTAFAARLQDTVDPGAVRADLADVVHAALEPTHVSVWLGS